jgi:hypothetical protein
MLDFHLDLAACLAGVEKAQTDKPEDASMIEW